MDSGSHAHITYSMLSGGLFSLDSRNGTISTLEIFDFEEQQSFEIAVKAFNTENPNLFDVAHVYVQVIDVNEYIPTFQKHLYNFSVPETLPPLTEIGHVHAVDFDLGVNGEALDSLFNLQASKTHVFGMKLQGDKMLLLAAVKSYNGLFLTGDVASGISNMHKKLLEAQSNVNISHITSDPCSLKPCQNGATCNKNIHISQEIAVLESSRLVFVSPHYAEVFNCSCLAGFTGARCESDIDECMENLCNNGGTCFNNPGGFFCNCREGFSGLHCSIIDNECQNVMCSNGGTCWNIQGGFFCECRPGYEGKCETHTLHRCITDRTLIPLFLN
uniref:Uncharacterized protein n=1 Tax=Astyanax mexicanus TaxID=7994 RepID=A0A8B9HT31_ASTMX